MLSNLELLELIESLLRKYQSRTIPFHQLVSETKAAFDALVEMDAEWKSDFDRTWFSLEEVNALALDEGQTEPLESDKEFADENVRKLLELTQNAKRDL